MKKAQAISVLTPFLLFGIAIFVNYFTTTSSWISFINWLYSLLGKKNASTNDIISASAFFATIANLSSFIPIIIQTMKANRRLWKKREIERQYLEMLRDSISRIYEGKELVRNITKEDINIRIFRKKGSYLNNWVKTYFFRRKYGKVISKDLEGGYGQRIGESIIFDLKRDRTCVTEAFKSGKAIHEFMDSHDSKYVMSDRNRFLSASTKFIVAYPVLNGKNKVKYVFSVDSTVQLCSDETMANRFIDPIKVLAYQYDQVLGK